MSVLGIGMGTVVLVVGLMGLCGAAIGRLLWLFEGRPPLDKPSWWPGVASTGKARDCTEVHARRGRTAFMAACGLCCGAPVLVMAGIVTFGVASAVSVFGGLLVLAAVVAWAVLAGRMRRRSRADEAPDPCCADPLVAEPAEGSRARS